MTQAAGFLAVSTVLFATGALAELENRDFSTFDQPQDGVSVGYDSGEGPPGWFITVSFDGGQVVFSDDDAVDGRAYYEFRDIRGPTASPGFGSNKLEQCVPIDASETVSISFSVFADIEEPPGGDLRTRVNPNFYASREDCLLDLLEDSGGRRLPGDRANDDFDHQFQPTEGRQWLNFSPGNPPNSIDGPLTYTVADIPEGTTYMNLSLRARDRITDTPLPAVRFDNIRVTQGASSQNLVINGSFEHAEVFDGAPLAGMSGWIVGRDGDVSRRAATGPQDFALSGANVFYFEDLSGNFGTSRLDQCFPLAGENIGASVFAYTLQPDPDLSVRLNIDFYPEADCGGDAIGALRIRDDFDLDTEPAAWVPLIVEDIRSAGEYADAPSALFSIRVRDRSGAGVNEPGDFERIVFFDDASALATVATPTFAPPPGQFVDSVTVTLSSATAGAVIYYTLDGSDPDDTASSVASGGTVEITATATLTARAFVDGQFSAPRAGNYVITAPPAPPPPPPRELSTGCSVSAAPSVMDPTLWLLLLIATAGLAWRRRERKVD